MLGLSATPNEGTVANTIRHVCSCLWCPYYKQARICWVGVCCWAPPSCGVRGPGACIQHPHRPCTMQGGMQGFWSLLAEGSNPDRTPNPASVLLQPVPPLNHVWTQPSPHRSNHPNLSQGVPDWAGHGWSVFCTRGGGGGSSPGVFACG